MRASSPAIGLGRLLSFKGIAEGVENTNYLVHTTSGTFILTIYEKRVDPADLPFFLGLMEHLSARGVTCPLPVRDTQRPCSQRARRPACGAHHVSRRRVAEAAEGRALPRAWEGARPNAYRGRELCVEARQCVGPHRLAAACSTSFRHATEEICPGLQRPDHVGASIPRSSRGPRICRTGVIHADLFPDNVFFVDDKLSGIIDFYFACNDALAYDIAVCLNAWCFDAEIASSIREKGGALLEGYDSVRPLSDAEREAMPILARGAAMRFLLTRSYDWLNTPKDALVARKDPADYVRRLKFHQSVGAIADYAPQLTS